MIIRIIDEHLKARQKEPRATRCFHPSTLHKDDDFLFKAYFEGDNGQEFSPRLLRIFDNGKSMHRRIQRYLKESGVLLEAEVPVENTEYEIVGSADGIICLDGLKGVLELKSINSVGFYGLFEPKPEHVIQLNVYMFVTGIPRGILLYENKNDQEIKEFFLKQDLSVLEPVLEKIKRVQKRIAQGESGVCGVSGVTSSLRPKIRKYQYGLSKTPETPETPLSARLQGRKGNGA